MSRRNGRYSGERYNEPRTRSSGLNHDHPPRGTTPYPPRPRVSRADNGDVDVDDDMTGNVNSDYEDGEIIVEPLDPLDQHELEMQLSHDPVIRRNLQFQTQSGSQSQISRHPQNGGRRQTGSQTYTPSGPSVSVETELRDTIKRKNILINHIEHQHKELKKQYNKVLDENRRLTKENDRLRREEKEKAKGPPRDDIEPMQKNNKNHGRKGNDKNTNESAVGKSKAGDQTEFSLPARPGPPWNSTKQSGKTGSGTKDSATPGLHLSQHATKQTPEKAPKLASPVSEPGVLHLSATTPVASEKATGNTTSLSPSLTSNNLNRSPSVTQPNSMFTFQSAYVPLPLSNIVANIPTQRLSDSLNAQKEAEIGSKRKHPHENRGEIVARLRAEDAPIKKLRKKLEEVDIVVDKENESAKAEVVEKHREESEDNEL